MTKVDVVLSWSALAGQNRDVQIVFQTIQIEVVTFVASNLPELLLKVDHGEFELFQVERRDLLQR